MSVSDVLKQTEEKMEKAIQNLKKEFANVRTGRANPLILEKVSVEYYEQD